MKRQLPRWFLIIAAILICYGWIVTLYMRFTENWFIISKLNFLNIGITLFWIFLNLGLIMAMGVKGFEKFKTDAKILPFYYFTLNTLNALNIQYKVVDNYYTLFWFSIFTKIIETIVITKMLKETYSL